MADRIASFTLGRLVRGTREELRRQSGVDAAGKNLPGPDRGEANFTAEKTRAR